ncbi:MAG: NAD(P)-dependent oxidoreductase [Gammaproteobacteria bacterium]|nr:NAD(P)-dependent oxidoreductase [Gammaproteobacteria bacterium]
MLKPCNHSQKRAIISTFLFCIYPPITFFSGEKNAPYVETDATNPLNVYGASKLAGELAIQKNMQQYIILRTSWVFSTSGNNFVKTMRRLFQEQTEVRVVNDQKSAPTSAIAIAKALFTIGRCVSSPSENFTHWGIYHFSGAPDITWYDFAHAIYNASMSENLRLQTLSAIQSTELNTKVKRPLYSFLNSEKIKNVFDIDPCDWQEDLRHTVSFLQQEVLSS